MSRTFLITLGLEDTSPEALELVAQEIMDLVQENFEVEQVEPWSAPNVQPLIGGTPPTPPPVG